MKKFNGGSVFLFCFVGCFIAVGLYGLGTGVYGVYDGLQTKSWHKTEATLLNVKMDVYTRKGSNRSEVVPIYEYSYNDKKYTDSAVVKGYSANNSDTNRELFEKLRQAKKIMVYVNPESANEAVIVKGFSRSAIGWIVFSIIWTSIVSLFFLIPFVIPETHSYKAYWGGAILLWIIVLAGYQWLSPDIDLSEQTIVIQNKNKKEQFFFDRQEMINNGQEVDSITPQDTMSEEYYEEIILEVPEQK